MGPASVAVTGSKILLWMVFEVNDPMKICKLISIWSVPDTLYMIF